MRGLHDFFSDVVGECSQQRHALGGSKRQVEPVHTALGESAARSLPLGAIPSSSQRCTTSGSADPPSAARPSNPTSSHARAALAGDQPCRRSGVTLGVVLPQPTVGALAIHRRLFGLVGRCRCSS